MSPPGPLRARRCRAGPRILDAAPALLPRPFGTPEGIRKHQSRLLRRVVAHAYHHVPLYRRVFAEAGVSPDAVREWSDVRRLPVVSREDLVRAAPEEILCRATSPARLSAYRTSGSSGMPLTLRRTWLERKLLHLYRLRALRHWRIAPWRKVVRVGVPPRHAAPTGAGPWRYTEVSVWLDPEEILARLRALRPGVVTGYPGELAAVACLIRDQDREVIRPRLVAVGGAVLTPDMRRQLEEGFRAPVVEWYGSFEFNLIAWECRSTRLLHICSDSVLVEVLADGRPAEEGEEGELVATNLLAYAMPIIRYRLGDLVIRGPDPCPCGSPFPTLRVVCGRMFDRFRLPDGRLFHPFELMVDVPAWVRRCELVQERLDCIVLRVEAVQPPASSELRRLRGKFLSAFGKGVQFQIEVVDQIRSEGVKFRAYRSLVHSQYSGVAGVGRTPVGSEPPRPPDE